MKLECDSSELLTDIDGCPVCEHPEQELINVAMLERKPDWYFKERFGIDLDDIWVTMHFKDHLIPTAKVLACLDDFGSGAG